MFLFLNIIFALGCSNLRASDWTALTISGLLTSRQEENYLDETMNNNSGGQGNQQQLRQNPTQRTGPIPGSGMNALGAHGAMAMPPALAVNNSGLGGVSGVGVFLPGMDVGMKMNTGMKNMMTVGMNAIGQGGRGTGDMNSMHVGMMGGNPSVGSASFSGTSLHQMQQQPNLNAINAMNLSQQQQQQLQQMQLQQLQAQISQQQQMGQHLNQHMQVNQQQHQKNQQQLNQHEMGNNQQQMGKMYQQTGNSQQHQMNQQHQHTTQQMNNAQPQMVSSGNKDNNPQHHLGHGQGQPQARGSRPNSQQSSSPFRWNQGSKTPVAFSSQTSAPQNMQMTGGNATLGFNALGNSSSVNSSHTMNQISNKSNVNVMSNTGSPPNAQQAQQMMQFQLEQQRTHQMQQMSQQQRLQAMHQQHLQQQIQGQQQGNQQIQQPPLSQQQDGQQEQQQQQQQQQFLQNQMQARALAQEQKKRMAQSQQQMLQQIQQQQYQQQQQVQNPKQQEQFQIQQRQQNQQQQNQQYHEQKNQQYQEQDSKIKSQQQIQQQQGRASFTMAQQQNQQQTRRNSSSSAQLLQENLHRNSITANQQHQQDNPLRRSFIMSQHMQLQQQQQQQQQHNKHQNSQQLAQQMQQENSLQKSLTVTKKLQQQQERHSITISQLSRPTSAQSNVARRPSAPIANSPSIQQQYYPNVTPPEQNQHHTQTGGLFESYGWQSSTSPLGLPEQSSTQCGSQRGLTLQQQQQQRQQNQLQQLQQQMQQQLNQQHLTQQQGKESSGNLSLLSSESFFNFNPASCFGGDNNISKGSYENRPSSRGTSTATYISMPAPPLSPLPFGADLAKKPPTPPLMESKPSQAQTISLRHEPTVVDADSKSGMKKAFEVNAETISSSLSTTHENTEGATAEVTMKTPSANTPAPTVPSDRTIKSSVATTVSSQTILTHDYYHNQHSSELPNDQVLKLANACSWEERTVWVARQVLGPGGSNGFSRATSAVQRLKRQRARQLQSTKNKDMNGTDNKDDGYSHPDMDEETLKRETFNPRLAKKMQSELKQGLQFCNLISEVITSILREIDPQHPLLGVQAPIVASSIPLNLMRPTIPLSTITNVGVGTKDDQNPIQPLGPEGSSKAGDQILSKIPKAANSKPSKSIGSLEKNKLVPMSPRFARASVGHANLEAETVAEGKASTAVIFTSRTNRNLLHLHSLFDKTLPFKATPMVPLCANRGNLVAILQSIHRILFF